MIAGKFIEKSDIEWAELQKKSIDIKWVLWVHFVVKFGKMILITDSVVFVFRFHVKFGSKMGIVSAFDVLSTLNMQLIEIYGNFITISGRKH